MSLLLQTKACVIVAALFLLGIFLIGIPKLIFHLIRFKTTRNRASGRYNYRGGKALSEATNALVFNGRSDETVSSHAGRLYQELGDKAPKWVLTILWLTDKFEPGHIIQAIEVSRPDDFDREAV